MRFMASCRFVSRNKAVSTGVADEIVRRYASEGQAAAAADMVGSKLEYGLFPSSDVYVELLHALANGGVHGRQTVQVFERLVIEHGPMVPSSEIVELIAAAAAAEGAGAEWAARVFLPCLAILCHPCLCAHTHLSKQTNPCFLSLAQPMLAPLLSPLFFAKRTRAVRVRF